MPGLISMIQQDGTYTVRFDGGEEESEVPRKLLRLANHTVKAFKFKPAVLVVHAKTAAHHAVKQITTAAPKPKPAIDFKKLATKHIKQELADELGINSASDFAKVAIVDHTNGKENVQDLDTVAAQGAAMERETVERKQKIHARKKASAKKAAKALMKKNKTLLKAEKSVKVREADRRVAAQAKREKHTKTMLRHKREQD